MNQDSHLENLIEEYRSIQLAKSHLAKLQVRIKEDYELLHSLGIILEKEYQDVLRMKKFKVKDLFIRVLDSDEEQYEIEKQEYLFAALQYNECKKSVELLEFEEKIILEKVAKERTVKAELGALITDREANISLNYPSIKQQLLNISSQLDECVGYKRELHEAIIVGLKAQKVLEQMINFISLGGNGHGQWGNYAPTFQAVQMYKNYLNKAHELSHVAKQLLSELDDEMADIYAIKSNVKTHHFEEFRNFTNIYHDNLISDWILQKRLHATLNTINSTNDNVRRLILTLKSQLKKTENSIKYLKKRKDEVIIEGLT